MTHIRPLTTVVLPLALVLVTAAWTLAAGTVPSAWAFPALLVAGTLSGDPMVRAVFRFADLSAVRAQPSESPWADSEAAAEPVDPPLRGGLVIGALERAAACVEAGADMVFPEAITELEMYKLFANRVKAPILANITEFGATPLYTTEQLAGADVSLVLYPLSAFRAMNKAAENVYTAIRRDGTQQNVIDTMQTRMELYDAINYHEFEQKLDALFAAKK